MGIDKRLKRELDHYRLKYDLYKKIPCTNKEDEEFRALLKHGKCLPEDVYQDSDYTNDSKFYRIACSDITQADIMEYLTYKKLDMLKTIKNCIVFFTVLAAIFLALLILGALF